MFESGEDGGNESVFGPHLGAFIELEASLFGFADMMFGLVYEAKWLETKKKEPQPLCESCGTESDVHFSKNHSEMIYSVCCVKLFHSFFSLLALVKHYIFELLTIIENIVD